MIDDVELLADAYERANLRPDKPHEPLHCELVTEEIEAFVRCIERQTFEGPHKSLVQAWITTSRAIIEALNALE